MIGVAARLIRGCTCRVMVVAFAVASAFVTNAFASHPGSASVQGPSTSNGKSSRRRPAVTSHPLRVQHHIAGHKRRRLRHTRHTAHHSTAGPRLLARCGYDRHAAHRLHSDSLYVVDVRTGKALLARRADKVRPIASISKLMTAVVARKTHRPLDGVLQVTASDRDMIKFTGSRLSVGSRLSRRDMYHVALMSSENRAAAALSRDFPGGRPAFVAAMNDEARTLQMRRTQFRDPTGLSPHNVSTATDLARLVAVAARDPLIHRFTTDRTYVAHPGYGELRYVNSNPVVRFDNWPIVLQKTGFVNEAGHCVVIHVLVHGRPETIVLLGAPTRQEMVLDASLIHHWLTCSLT
ncbi:serine hydrolase [Paraburkholderia sp. Ac-20336]|uniref:serine hydrolase n=1 Tax=Paraburkholderia sp. Ac-20336 TaxID=2703886 RepID=UPI001F11D485|nr:serine hydrolase [Paraburkholderia sp. Ac-20336]